MIATPLSQLALWAAATLTQGDGASLVTRVCTDTRALQAGDLFVALSGEQFDGHRFVAEAARAGACGAVVRADFTSEAEASLPADFALIRVADPLAALQAVATAYRASRASLRVVGITGSNGKTSTKDFTAAVLGSRFRVTKTEGNFNNHIGVPLTLLRVEAGDEAGVFEMGMNHEGEIAPLAAMAAPQVGIITNIGMAHIEFLGSREAIAREKGCLAEALPADGVLVLPAEDDFVEALARRTSATLLTAGIGCGTVCATVLETGLEGSRFQVRDTRAPGSAAVTVQLPVPGRHMIQNAVLALAAGLALGVSLEDGARGLAACRLTKGRLEQKRIHGIHVLDDSYNANPDSMRAALQTLASLPSHGARIAVLGRMGELGAEAERGHRSVGEAAVQHGISLLIVVGAEAKAIAEGARAAGLSAVHEVADPAAAAALLAGRIHPGDLLLLKGSRSARMERLLEHPPFQILSESLSPTETAHSASLV